MTERERGGGEGEMAQREKRGTGKESLREERWRERREEM